MQDLIDDLGGPAVVARMVGCKSPSVIEWRRRGIPAERCPAIERGSAGKYLCEVIRPDVVWHRVPDADWPWHAAGRPLIDVARTAAAPLEARDAA